MPETAIAQTSFERAADVFRLLTAPSRLAVISLLGTEEEEMSVGSLQERLGIESQGYTSRLLSGLRQGRLIVARVVGPERHYRLTDAGRDAFAMMSRFNAL